MLFKISYDVPANTAAASPDWQKLHVARGTITRWVVHMPEECADLMQFRVEYRGTQVLPFTRGEYMYGIFEPLSIEDDFFLGTAPYVLDILAFNLDDSYSHEYNIMVYVDPPTSPSEQQSSFDFRGAWSRIFGGGV